MKTEVSPIASDRGLALWRSRTDLLSNKANAQHQRQDTTLAFAKDEKVDRCTGGVARQETLDNFVEALHTIVAEDPDLLHTAPHTTPISRPDEVAAARKPVFRCCPAG